MLLSLSPAQLTALRTGALCVRTDAAVFRMEGRGAQEVLQGLLTNDVVRPGAWSMVYGAVLTPKGMIVVDHWVLRDESGFTLVTDAPGRVPSVNLFRRQVPPRLATVTDLTDAWQVLWLLGPEAHRAGAAGVPWPESAGGVARADEVLVARPGESAPMRGLVLGPEPRIGAIERALGEAGIEPAPPEVLHAARVLAGWPTLGREITEKTLPQEVRYDELDGVSYTKGCYVGQETVARVHFRGHPNRHLRGVRWEGRPPETWIVRAGAKEVGQISSALDLGAFGVGLALVRREVEPGSRVELGDRVATVVALPVVWQDGLRAES
jgi:folate-binding protein YgfZ